MLGYGIGIQYFGSKGGISDIADGGLSGASALLDGREGAAFDFTDMSCRIIDTVTPANDFDGDANDVLSGSTLSPSSTGIFVTAGNNIGINTTAFPFSASQGTVFVEFVGRATGSSVAYHIVSLSNGTLNEWVALRALNSNPEFLVFDSGNYKTLDAGTWIASGVNKIAAAWASNDAAVSYNGAAVVTNSTVGTPAATTLWIGRSFNASEYYEGNIVRLLYLPVRTINSELQAMAAA